MAIDVSPWAGLRLDAPLAGGHRNEVWSAHLRGDRVAVRRSRRSDASLAWELALLGRLATEGFLVPRPIATDAGQQSSDGVVVQEWIDGSEPETAADWSLVAAELQRLHRTLAGYEQRPGCRAVTELDRLSRSVDADIIALPDDVADEVLAVFAAYRNAPRSVIHGDPGPSNIRLTDDGRVGLLDWDESRVDVTDLDLVNLGGTQVLGDDAHHRGLDLADAWEVANGWSAEPDYARQRLASLRDRPTD